MQREFIITRLGKEYVLYAGLLDAAHQAGLRQIRTQLVQAPGPQNGFVAICHAEVVTERGTFTGLGDADPENTTRAMASALIRLAETRAKARALGDAINVAMTAFDELGDSVPDASPPVTQLAAPPRSPVSTPLGPPRTDTIPAPDPQPRGYQTDPVRPFPAVPLASMPTQAPGRPPARPRTAGTGRPGGASPSSPDPSPASPRSASRTAEAAPQPTQNQLDAIDRMSRALGRQVTTEGLTRAMASELITRLSEERYPARRGTAPPEDEV
ncbi:MAG: hypothetical protein EBQ56_08530 [Proteobacteria bacterium]|jgi:hypothetical protein|nr:hypothetical protein [Pseudomonadota bacterium]NBQ61785.1 hypothetical protein [Pseudomonadota bacterium]NBY47801.1 hypothetical protein [Pseudomonadota bacterium]NDB19528.1 hypothetical protein [Pseudomonadota bacterium]NDB70935.1 hypothetical protein [Pseudomonadota bacterium]